MNWKNSLIGTFFTLLILLVWQYILNPTTNRQKINLHVDASIFCAKHDSSTQYIFHPEGGLEITGPNTSAKSYYQIKNNAIYFLNKDVNVSAQIVSHKADGTIIKLNYYSEELSPGYCKINPATPSVP